MESDYELDSVKHIGIIGLGMIGDSLAVLTTGHGYRTTCLARNPDRIPLYKETYAMYFKQMIDRGLMPEKPKGNLRKYLKTLWTSPTLRVAISFSNAFLRTSSLNTGSFQTLRQTAPT
jgi:UDP-N-acetyl-D-mannosaminuronate dehydrogenase